MVEASVKQSVARLKMRRVPEGIEVSVETTAAVEALFASLVNGQAQGSIARRPGSSDTVSHYYTAGLGMTDTALARPIFAKGTSNPGGQTFVVPLARTREQMDRTAGEFRETMARLYEENLRPYEVSVAISARTGPAPEIA